MADQRSRVAAGSPDRFGFEWDRYREILPESRGQLERWLGGTGLSSFGGKSVLDVGCGMGRNPYWMARAGARSILAVDVDDRSLAAARENLAAFDSVRVARASVYDLDPGAHGTFDRVTCIGVLHHLEAPRDALGRMWSCVAPGGDLILWCYGSEGNRALLPLIQAARFVGSRLPVRATHLLARGLALAAYPAFKTIPWRTDYYRYVSTLSFTNLESIIFDQMIPRIAHYWTRADIEKLVAPLKGQAHIELVQDNSWHVRIAKPDLD